MSDDLSSTSDVVAAAATAAQGQIDEIVAATPPGQSVPAEQIINAVLAAYNYVQAGDPVGMIRKDPETGATAVREMVDGVPKWSVTSGGRHYFDMQQIDWPIIVSP